VALFAGFVGLFALLLLAYAAYKALLVSPTTGASPQICAADPQHPDPDPSFQMCLQVTQDRDTLTLIATTDPERECNATAGYYPGSHEAALTPPGFSSQPPPTVDPSGRDTWTWSAAANAGYGTEVAAAALCYTNGTRHIGARTVYFNVPLWGPQPAQTRPTPTPPWPP
jgi:hypothetical protein